MGPIATDVACVSHCLVFVSTMSCANMAEPIEMPFAVWTQVSPVDWVGRLGPESPLTINATEWFISNNKISIESFTSECQGIKTFDSLPLLCMA